MPSQLIPPDEASGSQITRPVGSAALRRIEPQELPRWAAELGAQLTDGLRSIRTAGGRPRFKLKTGTSNMNIVGPAWG